MPIPLNTWVRTQLRQRHWTQSRLEAETGIPHSTLDKDMKSNHWLLERAIRVVRALDMDCKCEEDFIAHGLIVDEWLEPRLKKKSKQNSPNDAPASRLKDALAKAEHAAPEDRESLLCAALRTIRLSRRAFLAVIATVVPSPFENRTSPRALQESLFAAHDQGLMVLFIAPSEAKEKLWREQFGLETQEASKHIDGFERYKQAYIDHLKSIGESTETADMRMHFVQEEVLDVAGWQYIVSLIGENQDDYGQFNQPFMRVFERGPASEGTIFLVPPHDRLHVGIRKYILNVLRRHDQKYERPFVIEFLNRMGVG